MGLMGITTAFPCEGKSLRRKKTGDRRWALGDEVM
jgi:hypothetical protein